MQFAKILFSFGVAGACAASIGSPQVQTDADSTLGPFVDAIDPLFSDNDSEERRDLSHSQTNRRWEMHCHLKEWESAYVDSIKDAYSWFYQLVAPRYVSAQQCSRIACFGTSAVWLCADTLGVQSANSVMIADHMNDLLDGDHGCLDNDDPKRVQGQVYLFGAVSILVRGGEDCSVDVPEEGLMYK